jgi:hypothetical protein
MSFLIRADDHFLGIDLDRDSMKAVYERFGLEPGTQDFIGHAMALYLDDEYDAHFVMYSYHSHHFSIAISINLLAQHSIGLSFT